VINRILSKPLAAVAWTLIIQILLCLPGSALPSEGIFKLPHLDKLVHISLFGGCTGLWCYYFYLKGTPAAKLKTIFFIIYLLVSCNGIVLEFIQRDYIPNRSFEQADIIADIIAASIAYGICNIKLLKTAA
jgi:VanZ family protein